MLVCGGAEGRIWIGWVSAASLGAVETGPPGSGKGEGARLPSTGGGDPTLGSMSYREQGRRRRGKCCTERGQDDGERAEHEKLHALVSLGQFLGRLVARTLTVRTVNIYRKGSVLDKKASLKART